MQSQQPRIERYFVCVGAQKAGTTWLASALAMHPDVFVTPVKEIHYFDHVAGLSRHLDDARRRSRYRKYQQRLWTQWRLYRENRAMRPWYRRYMASPIDDTWYASLFDLRGGRSYAGEATPEYATIGVAGFRHMLRLAPQARIIFIMRNPVRQAWSQVLHQCRSRRLDARRMAPEDLIAIAEEPGQRALGDYGRTLADLAAAFAPDQVLRLFYEDIHADRMVALDRIAAFIGTKPLGDWPRSAEAARNISQDVTLPAAVEAHLRRRGRAIAAAVESQLGRLPESWQSEFGL